MTLQEGLLTLRKHIWLIMAGALIAGAVALVFSLVWPPSYKAEALLLVTKLRPEVTLDPRFQTAAEENIVNLSIQDDQVRRQTLVGLAQSAELMSELLDYLGDTLSADERSLSYLEGATDVSTQGNLIVFEAEADSGAKAATIANAWATVYRDRVNMLYSATSPSYEQIQEQVAEAQAVYEAANTAVEQWERSSTERELGRQIGQKLQILQDLEAGQLAAARGQVGGLLAWLNEIDQLALSAASLRAQLASGPGSAELSTGEQFALFSLEASAFTPSMPFSVTLDFGEGWMEDAAITADQAVDRLDSLQTTLEMAKERLEADVAELSLALLEGGELLTYGPDGEGVHDIARLQQEINDLKAELQAQQQARQDLLDEQQLTRENYLTLSRKAAEVQILSELTSVEVQSAAAAREPEKPAFPRPLLTTALGVVAGGLAGLALAFLLETKPAQEE